MNKKQVGGSVLVSDKIDFKPKLIQTDREGYCISIQGEKKHQKDIAILSIYAPKDTQIHKGNYCS